jgi:hypothetical protein
MSRTNHDVRELRLALVLPGGVSLAIYMFGVTRELHRLVNASALLDQRLKSNVRGVGRHHFGAFFSRADRENDYLWGRLDAAEVLVGLLVRGRENDGRFCLPAFHAILEEEEGRLAHMRKLFVELEAALGTVST